MSLLNDTQIAALCTGDTPMIAPYMAGLISDGVISYGLNSSAYDIRIGNAFKLPIPGATLDPKNPDEAQYQQIIVLGGDRLVVPPKSFVLGYSVERFDMPRNIKAFALTKSTYARIGVFANITPLENQWAGYLTIEIANLGETNAVIYPMEGIASLQFFDTGDVAVSYADRKGKYNNQAAEAVLGKV